MAFLHGRRVGPVYRGRRTYLLVDLKLVSWYALLLAAGEEHPKYCIGDGKTQQAAECLNLLVEMKTLETSLVSGKGTISKIEQTTLQL